MHRETVTRVVTRATQPGVTPRRRLPPIMRAARARWVVRRLGVVLGLITLACTLHFVWERHETRLLGEAMAPIRARGEALRPSDVVVPKVRPEDDAAPLLRKAGELLVDSREYQRLYTTMYSYPLLPEQLVDAKIVMAANAPALALMREAAAKPDAVLFEPYRSPMQEYVPPNMQPFRELAGRAHVNVILAHQLQNTNEALQSVDDTLALGRHLVRHDPLLTTWLLGAGVTALGVGGLDEIVPTLQVMGEE